MLTRTIATLSLLLLTAGCPSKTPPQPPARAELPMPAGWWEVPDLQQVPIERLVRVRLAVAPWNRTAARLGLPQGEFSEQTWGAHTVMAHGPPLDEDLAFYMGGPHGEPLGMILRGLNAQVTMDSCEPMLVGMAARADHGDTWDLFTEPTYVRLVSTLRPVSEVGCWFGGDEPACHVKVFHPSFTHQDYVQQNGGHGPERRLRVR